MNLLDAIKNCLKKEGIEFKQEDRAIEFEFEGVDLKVLAGEEDFRLEAKLLGDEQLDERALKEIFSLPFKSEFSNVVFDSASGWIIYFEDFEAEEAKCDDFLNVLRSFTARSSEAKSICEKIVSGKTAEEVLEEISKRKAEEAERKSKKVENLFKQWLEAGSDIKFVVENLNKFDEEVEQTLRSYAIVLTMHKEEEAEKLAFAQKMLLHQILLARWTKEFVRAEKDKEEELVEKCPLLLTKEAAELIKNEAKKATLEKLREKRSLDAKILECQTDEEFANLLFEGPALTQARQLFKKLKDIGDLLLLEKLSSFDSYCHPSRILLKLERLSFSLEQNPKKQLAESIIKLGKIALAGLAEESSLREWGRVNFLMGVAFARLYEITGHPELAQHAEKFMSLAFLAFSENKYPSAWATVQHSLGVLYSSRYEKEEEKRWAEKAKEHYQNALKYRTEETSPSAWAMVQHSLGVLYLRRYEKEGNIDWAEKAKKHYQNALKYRTEETSPSAWAMVQHSLGNLYLSRYEKEGNIDWAEKAKKHYQNASESWLPETSPAYTIELSKSAVKLHYLIKDISSAKSYFNLAKESLQILLLAKVPYEKYKLLGKHAGVYKFYATLLAEEGKAEEALRCIEEGSNVLLREGLSLEEFRLKRENPEAYKQVENLRRKISQLQKVYEKAGEGERAEIRKQIESDVSKLRELLNIKMEVEKDFLRRLEIPEDTAVVRLLLLSDTAFAFVIRKDRISLVKLEGLSEREFRKKFISLTPGLSEIMELLSKIKDGEKDVDDLKKALMKIHKQRNNLKWYFFWYLINSGILIYLKSFSHVEDPLLKCFNDSSKVLENHLKNCFWNKIEPYVKGIKRLIIVPSSYLYVVPLHIAIPEKIGISYAPSLSFYATLQGKHKEIKPSGKALLVHAAGDLENAGEEVDFAAELFARKGFEVKNIGRKETTKEEILREIEGSSIFHFSGHAFSNFLYPFASSLYYDGKKGRESIRLEELMAEAKRFEMLSLSVLSSCQTGVTTIWEAEEEYLSLLSAFLQLGSSAVVGTLWPVSDKATAEFMKEFYRQLIEEGKDLDFAVRAAASRLRANPNFENSYYWAGFVLYGLPLNINSFKPNLSNIR